MSDKILAIDPGVHLCAAAEFFEGLLAQLYYQPAELYSATEYSEVHIEVPRVYPMTTPNYNDIVDLAFAAGKAIGGLQSRVGKVILHYPRDWAGSVPKQVRNARLVKVLTPEEQRTLDAACARVGKSKAHNLWDAVGIGLFALRRVGKGMCCG